MRYLILLLLSSCLADVLPDSTACEEFVAEVHKHSHLCDILPPDKIDSVCGELVVTNPSELRDTCIPQIAVMSCPDFEAQKFCKPEGLKL